MFQLGIPFEQVDYVFCTHLHIDHTGRNTMLWTGAGYRLSRKRNTFFTRREYAAWEADSRKGDLPGAFSDNCLPVVEAGRALLVDNDYALDDITLTPAPGHSPGHYCINILSKGAARRGGRGPHASRVSSAGSRTGRPVSDWDPKQSAVSRRKFFAEVADTNTLILPVHFPTPTVGLLKTDGAGFDYRFKRD